jgi:hypothetical protein
MIMKWAEFAAALHPTLFGGRAFSQKEKHGDKQI